MGWKASTVIINNPTDIDKEKLLHALGYTKLTKIDDETFEVVINPDDNKVYIGEYNNNLLICDVDLPMQFFQEQLSDVEKALIKLFPDSEICSIILHSVVNLWGYAVIKNGQKIRARSGSADDGTFLEFGEPLPEETGLLSQSTVNGNGSRTYIFESFPGESFTEDQVGENFVFEICSRYFGESLDSADELLFETILAGYRYSNNSIALNQTNSNVLQPAGKASKPWWKFW